MEWIYNTQDNTNRIKQKKLILKQTKQEIMNRYTEIMNSANIRNNIDNSPRHHCQSYQN